MTNVVRYASNAENTQRHPSPAVWAGVNLTQVRDWFDGFIAEDDFTGDHDLTNKYTLTQATQGTFALDDAEGGVALIDCNSTTATQGANVQAAGTVGEAFVPQADDLIIFECRLKAADIATGPEFFAGLCEINTAIIASSAVAAPNFVGFFSVTDDNILLFAAESAASQTATSTPETLVDDTYVKLGFRIEGTDRIRVFVNGVEFSEQVESNIPTVALVPSFVCQSGGTTDPIVHVDWWRCVQLIDKKSGFVA
jgi:hypothetical protein